MRSRIFGLVVLTSSIVLSCAQPRPVTGGAQDVTPPKIIASVPANFSTQFSGNNIMLEFDEYIQVRSLGSEVVVSPPLQYPLEFKLKGKRVYFTIRDTLSPETTYNLNFGNAIVDNNEGNPLDSNLFVFSTGTLLDSGSISGTVKDAYTMKPLKDVTIAVFSAGDDSAIYLGNPIYISKTDSKGRFQLNYLGSRDYELYALESPGPDYNYLPLTKVGFYPFSVYPENADSIDIFLFTEPDTTQYVTKEYSSEYYLFTLGFHLDLKQPKFDFLPTSDSVNYIVQEIAADSFNFWIPGDIDLDSVTVFIQDSDYLDTVKINVESRELFYKKLKREKKETSPVRIRSNTTSGVFHYFDTLRFQFSRPITTMDTEKVQFIQGTDTLAVDSMMSAKLLGFSVPDSSFLSGITLSSSPVSWDWKPSTDYGFIFYPGAFTDIIHQTNDTTILTFKTQGFEDYGSFRFTVNVPGYDGPLRLEFLDANGNFLKDYQIRSGDVIYRPLVVPGKYSCRLIIDENGNNRWDTGDLIKKILPEYIMYYDGVIEIKPNWDMEETWVVNLK